MNKMIAIASLVTLSALTSTAHANLNMGLEYTSLSDDSDGIDITLGTVGASLGYLHHVDNSNLSIMPLLRVGLGVNDDSFRILSEEITVEAKSLITASVRGAYHVTDAFAVFIQPSYARLDIEVSTRGFSEAEDEWEFGFGGGVQFAVSDAASLEVTYERFDDTDAITAGVRFSF